MAGSFDIGEAPKALRPALWVLSLVIGLTSLGAFGLSAVETKAQAAASAQAAPLLERVSKLEGSQGQLWNVVNGKLDRISDDIAQTRQDVAVLSQRVNDGDKSRK